jgi:hypothetical protein
LKTRHIRDVLSYLLGRTASGLTFLRSQSQFQPFKAIAGPTGWKLEDLNPEVAKRLFFVDSTMEEFSLGRRTAAGPGRLNEKL